MHIRSIVAPLLKWFAGNARDLPWRWTRDPYAIWVSEIMLQQTQVKTVIPYWQRWMKQLPDIASLAAADEDTVGRPRLLLAGAQPAKGGQADPRRVWRPLPP